MGKLKMLADQTGECGFTSSYWTDKEDWERAYTGFTSYVNLHRKGAVSFDVVSQAHDSIIA